MLPTAGSYRARDPPGGGGVIAGAGFSVPPPGMPERHYFV